MDFKKIVDKALTATTKNVSDARIKEVKSSLARGYNESMTEAELIASAISLLNKGVTTAFSFVQSGSCPQCKSPMIPCVLHNDRKGAVCPPCRITIPAAVGN